MNGNVEDKIRELEGAGCHVRTVHMRPIVLVDNGTQPLEGPDGEYEEGVFPDGSVQLCIGTREQLEKYRETHGDRVRFHDTGGQTHVTIEDPHGTVYRGVARCLPETFNEKGEVVPGDQYDRRLGRRIALGRALKNLEAGQEEAYTSPATQALGGMLSDLLKEFESAQGAIEWDEIELFPGVTARIGRIR